jgi:hypothetical protein
MKEWNWFQAGIGLAASFLLAVILVKPIGVSTQFVILNGIIAKAINPEWVQPDPAAKSGYKSPNSYLNKSGGKYAQNIAHPLNYSFIFVVAMLAGGWIARVTRRDKTLHQIPEIHAARFGRTPLLRFVLAFFGGVIVLWGARLAGGCTSGHMISGMMQTAVSGYLFAGAVFLVAVPVAWILYRVKGGA